MRVIMVVHVVNVQTKLCMPAFQLSHVLRSPTLNYVMGMDRVTLWQVKRMKYVTKYNERFASLDLC